eukprot:CCRYP_015879-RB/>CCRYP_015879-RB protein AED:0.44 eAED:1.00 QI:0/0/0/1/0/0/2/0/99
MSTDQPRFKHTKQQTGSHSTAYSSQQQDVIIPAMSTCDAESISNAVTQTQSFPSISIRQASYNTTQDHAASVSHHEKMSNISLGIAIGGIKSVKTKTQE